MAESGSELIDPELLDLLDRFPPLVLSADRLADIRHAVAGPSPFIPVSDASVAVTLRAVPGPPGAPEVPLVITRPKGADAPLPAIMHMHAGGYVLGGPAMVAQQHRQLAASLACCILSVDYRLAPETPFPGAIEDCYAALGWAMAHAAALGIDDTRIGVMGESAGGGLAASLALLTRDRGEHRLAFQHLIYPMIDDRTGREPALNPHAGQCLWTADNNAFGWSALLGAAAGTDQVSPYAAAARAADLAGLPPAFIATGALDLFVEENTAYAMRMTRQAVPVELHVYPGAFHGFDIHPTAAVARQARNDSRAALARALRPPVRLKSVSSVDPHLSDL